MTEIAAMPAEQAEHLTDDERAALIERLREFGDQQTESQQIADRGSLERATDLMRLYEDKSWMDELPAPGRRSKVPPDDFRRFTKWAVEDNRLGLARKEINFLDRTERVRAILADRSAVLAGATAKALRPLSWMRNNDYADRMGEVWQAARQLAEGDSPSEMQVRKALSNWKQNNIPKVESDQPKAKGVPQKMRRWEQEGERLLREHPTAFLPELERLVKAYERLGENR